MDCMTSSPDEPAASSIAKKCCPFQQRWLKEYAWLRYDNSEMYCAVCHQESVSDKSSTLVISLKGELRKETLMLVVPTKGLSLLIKLQQTLRALPLLKVSVA